MLSARYSAYFVITTDCESGEILSSGIWSSPPWDQSRKLRGTRTGVYFQCSGDSFHTARELAIRSLASMSLFDDSLNAAIEKLEEPAKSEYAAELVKVRADHEQWKKEMANQD